MTRDKKEFIEAMLTWFRSPKVGNDEELDRKFLASAYDNITQPHWISVEDELPIDYEPVLAVVGGNHFAFVGICLNRTTWYCDIQNKAVEIKGITHWCHLPQPPKGGEK